MDAVADFDGAERMAFAAVACCSNRGALRTAADTIRRVQVDGFFRCSSKALPC
jgi:hypothetical protein